MLTAVMAGCGAMSDGWLNALREVPYLASHVRLIGLIDLNPSMATLRARKHGLWASPLATIWMLCLRS